MQTQGPVPCSSKCGTWTSKHLHPLGDAGLVPHSLADWCAARASVKSAGLPNCQRLKHPGDLPGRSCLRPDLSSGPTPLPPRRHEDALSSNLLGAEDQVLLGDADQEEGVKPFKVLGAQGEGLRAGEVQLSRFLQQCRGLLLSLVLLGSQEGLEENQHLWEAGPGLGSNTLCAELPEAWAVLGALLETGGGRKAGRGHDPGATPAPREL